LPYALVKVELEAYGSVDQVEPPSLVVRITSAPALSPIAQQADAVGHEIENRPLFEIAASGG
jgi:hypothetical protein